LILTGEGMKIYISLSSS